MHFLKYPFKNKFLKVHLVLDILRSTNYLLFDHPKISLPICIPTAYYKATDISHITIDDKWNKRMMMIWNGYYGIIY